MPRQDDTYSASSADYSDSEVSTSTVDTDSAASDASVSRAEFNKALAKMEKENVSINKKLDMLLGKSNGTYQEAQNDNLENVAPTTPSKQSTVQFAGTPRTPLSATPLKNNPELDIASPQPNFEPEVKAPKTPLVIQLAEAAGKRDIKAVKGLLKKVSPNQKFVNNSGKLETPLENIINAVLILDRSDNKVAQANPKATIRDSNQYFKIIDLMIEASTFVTPEVLKLLKTTAVNDFNYIERTLRDKVKLGAESKVVQDVKYSDDKLINAAEEVIGKETFLNGLKGKTANRGGAEKNLKEATSHLSDYIAKAIETGVNIDKVIEENIAENKEAATKIAQEYVKAGGKLEQSNIIRLNNADAKWDIYKYDPNKKSFIKKLANSCGKKGQQNQEEYIPSFLSEGEELSFEETAVGRSTASSESYTNGGFSASGSTDISGSTEASSSAGNEIKNKKNANANDETASASDYSASTSVASDYSDSASASPSASSSAEDSYTYSYYEVVKKPRHVAGHGNMDARQDKKNSSEYRNPQGPRFPQGGGFPGQGNFGGRPGGR